MKDMNRRELMAAGVALGGAALLGGCGSSGSTSSAAKTTVTQTANRRITLWVFIARSSLGCDDRGKSLY